jgi:5'-phosphate synthase pdxT subunit
MDSPGILALQGGFAAHKRILIQMGYFPIEVRTPSDLDKVDRLILPGGESTVIIKLLKRTGLLESLQRKIQKGMPVFGTCAGMILLSSGVEESSQPTLSAMDFTVERNAYGRQIASFETTLDWQGIPLPALFIRAPQIRKTGKAVNVLIRYEETPVLVRQNNCLAASFHPELTDSRKVHRYFLEDMTR